MSNISKKSPKQQLHHVKKFNPDTDIVAIRSNGFGVFTSDYADSDVVLEFYSKAPSAQHEVCLASISIDHKFVENMIKRLKKVLDDKKELKDKEQEIIDEIEEKND